MAVATHIVGRTLALLAAASPLVALAAPQDMPGGPAVRQLNLAAPVTGIASQMYDLHLIMLGICSVIFVVVFGFMFYSIYAHRKSKGHKAADFHESTTVEIAWTVVPMLIVIVMAGLATKAVLEMKDTSNADITIKATGYQWKWGYDYLKGEGEGIRFVSKLSTPRDQIDGLTDAARAARAANTTYLLEVDNELVVPVGRKIRILTTADDVIHAWMVPAFGVKQDAIPGFIRDTWFKAEKVGIYRGQCAELCGKEHGFMPIVVNVKSDADYAKWVGEQKKLMAAKMDDPNKQWTAPELVARGEKVYAANCVACHQANGKGLAPAFPPLDGVKIVTGPKDNPIAILLNGRQGTAMASFKGLSDVELAAVLTYVRNTWTNKTDDAVTPAEVKAARGWDAAKMTQLTAKQ
ncbi:MAG: cytochrome c oxidase subunit II [Burkholderiales bacterium]|nr:cytochrome c oxidase subunit II [Burkholderiales bacterium]